MTDDLDDFNLRVAEEAEQDRRADLEVVPANAFWLVGDGAPEGAAEGSSEGSSEAASEGASDRVPGTDLDELPFDALDDLPVAMAPPDDVRAAVRDGLDGPDALDRLESPVDSPAPGSGPSHTATWTVAAALCVGLACGFGGGYMARGRLAAPDSAPSIPPRALTPIAPPSAPAPATREYTEDAINEAPRDAVREPNRDNGDADGGVEPQPDQSSAPGRLLVRSTPADAQVFVDGHERGRTPATIRGLARGTHRVRVVRDGYVVEDRPIVITTEQPAQSVSVSLEPQVATAAAAPRSAPQPQAVDGTLVGALDVESRPAGARVFLDGTLLGTTPFASARISAGRHAIGLERDGYRRWLSSVWIAHGERNRITASLER